MKALSLTQPWASAVALEVKRWETRSWPIAYRGALAIHAAKGFPGWAKEFAKDEKLMLDTLPLGMIVCVCSITDCRRTEDIVGSLSAQEQKWGDYSPGRFAYKLEGIRPLAVPIPFRGALGLWPVPLDLWHAITGDPGLNP